MEVVHLIEVRQIPKSRQDVRYNKVEVVPKYLLVGWLITQTPEIPQGTDSHRAAPNGINC